jgi:hypothetical protein
MKKIFREYIKKYNDEKDIYEDFKVWLAETDGYYNAKRYLDKEGLERQEYKNKIRKSCSKCYKANQILFYVERKFLCMECRDVMWETIKVFMIERLEGFLMKEEKEQQEKILKKEETNGEDRNEWKLIKVNNIQGINEENTIIDDERFQEINSEENDENEDKIESDNNDENVDYEEYKSE